MHGGQAEHVEVDTGYVHRVLGEVKARRIAFLRLGKDEIATFCSGTYDVRFPLFAKVVTRDGPAQSSVYRFLGSCGRLPSWNFGKYVVGRDGRVKAYFSSRVAPDDETVRNAIDAALDEPPPQRQP